MVTLLAEALPGSTVFSELRGLLTRNRNPFGTAATFGADYRGVRTDLNLSRAELADILEVPLPVIYALEAGWKVLSTANLLSVAEQINVSLGFFFHDIDGQIRPFTRQYRAYVDADKTIQHL